MSIYRLFPTNDSRSIPIQIMPKELTLDQMVKSALSVTNEEGNCFYIVDLGVIREQYQIWKKELPRVFPYYAVKCNPNFQIMKLLAELGANFDCASIPEIEATLSLGVCPSRIIYANPCKSPGYIRRAMELGVHTMTADNIDEIKKIGAINPQGKILIRIVTDDKNALCQFSSKFGAQETAWEPILQAIKDCKLDFMGVSFHVGSGSSDNKVYPSTLRNVRKLFDVAIKMGFNPDLIDIGGGFPGNPDWTPPFTEIAAGIRAAIDELFPDDKVRFIGEPGRYFAERSHMLVARIIARRYSDKDVAAGKNVLYYIDEGTYQSFNCIVNDHYVPKYHFVSRNGENDDVWKAQLAKRAVHKSTIFGPTCDSIDTIYRDVDTPLMEIGEWMVFPNMGAYTCAPSAPFNGFVCGDFRYVDRGLHYSPECQPTAVPVTGPSTIENWKRIPTGPYRSPYTCAGDKECCKAKGDPAQ